MPCNIARCSETASIARTGEKRAALRRSPLLRPAHWRTASSAVQGPTVAGTAAAHAELSKKADPGMRSAFCWAAQQGRHLTA